MTRPPNDPLTNPQPGDVVKSPCGVERTVLMVNIQSVSYRTNLYDIQCEFCCSMSEWRLDMSEAEVLNVAQQ